MHIPSASPVLPVPVGSEAGMWAPPPTPSTMSTSHHLQSPTREADVLPLFWEFNSGDGVTCGASLWETVSLFAQFIESFCFVSINCSLSLHTIRISYLLGVMLTLIVPSCHLGWENLEIVKGNLRKFERK